MTRLGSDKTWMIALGFLTFAAAGCPRQTFDLGRIKHPTAGAAGGIAGAAGGGAGAAGAAGSSNSDKSCGSRGQAACDDGEFCNFPASASCGETDKPGVCTDLPQACDLIYKPVCGCDGKTYGNTCEANSKGVSIRSEGACPSSDKSCGGLTGKACASGQYCDYAIDAICGAADATGTCKTKPQICRDIYQPVCGCDDQTYGNACEANSKGVSVASEGECGASGDTTCGGLTGKACGDGEYCNYPPDAICGAADATGTCQAKPSVCTLEFLEVCGCDDKTYSNACEAASAGTSVAHTGACESTGQAEGENCGGIAGLSCSAGQYCNYAQTANCGAADQFGKCTKQPTACTKEFHAVCGCDGVTYSNPCMAGAAGVSIASDGECKSGSGSGKTCGGLTGAGCAKGEYCNFPESAQCGAADQTGTCSAIPGACTLEYAPVCGCDDKTYGNACGAASAGVSVLHKGEC